VVRLRQAVTLKKGRHGAVEHQDALGEGFLQGIARGHEVTGGFEVMGMLPAVGVPEIEDAARER
jgi:hypothetical protein